MSTIETPCLTDDDTNCTWDATTQGNGEGTSYTDNDGVTTPLPTPTSPTLPMPGIDDPTWIEMGTHGDGTATVHTLAPLKEVKVILGDALHCPDIIAVDQIDDSSWWGYCEPALDVDSDYTPNLTHTEVATPPADTPHTSLAETGGADVNPAFLIAGIVLIIAGVAATLRNSKRR